MSREEAIKLLRKLRETIDRNNAYGEAEEMAIQALEQEPCENAISREKVLLMIDSFKDNYGSLIDLAREVRKMPPVDPQLKTGHWIIGRIFPTKITDENLIEYRCSECDRAIRCTESQLVNYPYCHCGAKMVEPQERSE